MSTLINIKPGQSVEDFTDEQCAELEGLFQLAAGAVPASQHGYSKFETDPTCNSFTGETIEQFFAGSEGWAERAVKFESTHAILFNHCQVRKGDQRKQVLVIDLGNGVRAVHAENV